MSRVAASSQKGPALPDPAFNKLARAAAGAALGAVLAGLPVLWGQIGLPVILSAGLAIFWTVIVVVALKQFGGRARLLLLTAPMAWLWPMVAAWLLWSAP